MSYVKKQSIDIHTLLRSVLPEYTPVSEAPTRAQLEDIGPGAWDAEKSKRYKCVDTNGNIYVGRNPCCLEKEIVIEPDGRQWVQYVRIKPRMVMTYEEAIGASKSRRLGNF